MASPVPKLKTIKATKPLGLPEDEAHGNAWDPATGTNKPIGGTKPAVLPNQTKPGILAGANPGLGGKRDEFDNLARGGAVTPGADGSWKTVPLGGAPARETAGGLAEMTGILAERREIEPRGTPAAVDPAIADQREAFASESGQAIAAPAPATTPPPGAQSYAPAGAESYPTTQPAPVAQPAATPAPGGLLPPPGGKAANPNHPYYNQPIPDQYQTNTATAAPAAPPAVASDAVPPPTTDAAPAPVLNTQPADDAVPAPTLDTSPPPAAQPAAAPPVTGATDKPAVDYSQILPPPESMGAAERVKYYQQYGVDPPPGTPGGATVAAAPGTPAWTPTAGIADQVEGIDPQQVEATGYETTDVGDTQQATAGGYDAAGYTAQQAPEAEGFIAKGYKPTTVDENLSQAVTRITDQDGILMQRRGAQAQAAANARGLGNSTMALESGQAAVIDAATTLGQGDVQVGMFNADVKNQAAQFLSNWENTAAQFIAAERNQNGRFNAQQANEAAAFTANAKNQAAALEAAAKNTASMFNAGEANRKALFVAEQANLASRFAAEADNAAKMFNASEYNKAMQRYKDAFNAALAAQNDAVNMSRRDTAMIDADYKKQQAAISGQLQAASINASGAAAAAGAQREVAMAQLAQRAQEFGATLSQNAQQFAANLSATQFNQFQSGLNAGMLTQMEPGDRQNWLNNYMSMWDANGGLNFGINMDMFPPSGGGTTPPPSSGGTTNPLAGP